METAIKTGDVDTAIRLGRTTAAAFRQLDDCLGTVRHPVPPRMGAAAVRPVRRRRPGLEEAIDVARGAGLWNTAQWALADLAIEKVHLGDHDTARQLFDEAAAASREIGDGAGEVLAGYGYGLLAHVARDWDGAREHYAVAVDAFVDLGTPVYEGIVLAGLGRCDEADGDTPAALTDTRRRWSWVAGSANRASPRLPSKDSHASRSLRVTAIPPPHDSMKRPASGNDSTGRHHRMSVPTSSTSSKCSDAEVARRRSTRPLHFGVRTTPASARSRKLSEERAPADLRVGSTAVHLAAPTVEAVDTTRAGDAFVGAFAFGLAEGMSATDASRAAASSRASGIPPRARLIRPTASRSGSEKEVPGRSAGARTTNSCAAG